MPKYFFNCLNGGVDLDREGTELEGDAAARRQAIVFAGEILRNEPETLQTSRSLQVEVSNDRGKLLFTVALTIIDAPGDAGERFGHQPSA